MTEEYNLALVGNRINTIRINKGLTMEEFGHYFKTSKGTINNWEKGRNLPNKENLKIIADLGGITVSELLYGKRPWIQLNTGVFIEMKEPITFDDAFELEDRMQYVYKCRILLSTTDWLANRNYAEIELFAYVTINIYIIESKESFDYYRIDGIEELYQRPYEGLFGAKTYNSVSEYLVKKVLETDELKSMKLLFDDLEPLS